MFFQKQAENRKTRIYIEKCLYICDFLPKIKVGRPPYLALWGASPLGKSINDCWDGMTAPIPREREREREREEA